METLRENYAWIVARFLFISSTYKLSYITWLLRAVCAFSVVVVVCLSHCTFFRNVLNVDDLYDHHNNNRTSNTSFCCTRFLSCVLFLSLLSFDSFRPVYMFLLCVCARDYVSNVELTINGICVIHIKLHLHHLLTLCVPSTNRCSSFEKCVCVT